MIIALADCNNFYVSCERVFCAEIAHRPVIVLGNNDGCVVARSNEAKALGIAMGIPLFQCRHLVERYQVAVYSSNYALYQDMSNRVMTILARFAPQIEIYSIDEAFLDLSHIAPERLERYARHIRAQVLQRTGIPISIGIAPTKVLTKVACDLVKQQPSLQGVLNLVGRASEEMDMLLATIRVADVWGIGYASARRLHPLGIRTANDLKHADHCWIRRLLNVAAQRAVLELQGVSCLPLETQTKPKKGIMASQSFGRPIEQLHELEEAVTNNVVLAAVKLRKQHSRTMHLSIFMHTSVFETGPQYAAHAERTLPFPTAFTPDLLYVARQLVQQVFRPGYRYRKAGVYLCNLHSQEILQPDLFGIFSWEQQARQERLMAVIDIVNDYLGRDVLFWGAQGVHREWQMRQRHRSPRSSTRWKEILQVT